MCVCVCVGGLTKSARSRYYKCFISFVVIVARYHGSSRCWPIVALFSVACLPHLQELGFVITITVLDKHYVREGLGVHISDWFGFQNKIV